MGFLSFDSSPLCPAGQPRRADPAVRDAAEGELRRVGGRPEGDDLLGELALGHVDGAPDLGPEAREEGHVRPAAQQGVRGDELRLGGPSECE